MNRATLIKKWNNKEYTGLPQWFIDEMVDEERLDKRIEEKERIEEYKEWESKQYWPRSKWYDL